MNQETKSYQLTCLFSPLLNQSSLEEIIQNIKKEIIAQGGSVSGTLPQTNHQTNLEQDKEETGLTNLIKKTLTYPIKKYQEAFYLSLNLLLPAQTIDQFSQKINSDKNILRCLIVAKQELKSKPKKDIDYNKIVEKIEPLLPEKSIPISQSQPLSDIKEEPAHKQAAASDSKKKVKIEELDKKLEEILNE